MLSYEEILSNTVYLPPLLFMAGHAAIVANNAWVTLVLNALVGPEGCWLAQSSLSGSRLVFSSRLFGEALDQEI